MKQVTISITEQQEKFLKLFAEKQTPGAPDNRYTSYPLHIVENKRYNYIPYSYDIAEYFDEDDLVFTNDDDYAVWFTNEVEMVKDWYSDRDCPIEIKSFKELEYQDITGVNGEESFVTDYNEYFEVYGVSVHQIAWRKEYYEQVAMFFILEEAKRYMQYQKHNLESPRVYTYSAGYANDGEYTHFWDLLMVLGKQLNQVEHLA
ncbi:hypothetical protein [Brevibacillus fortis]|nr:hypothetical protein [Brevibacillus fortis]